MMIAIILLAIMCVIAVGYIVILEVLLRIQARAFTYYIIKKGYIPPTREEKRNCIKYVIGKMFKIRSDY